MQKLVPFLACLAAVPVLAFGTTIDSSAIWSLLCVGLIAVSLYVMFSTGETGGAAH